MEFFVFMVVFIFFWMAEDDERKPIDDSFSYDDYPP